MLHTIGPAPRLRRSSNAPSRQDERDLRQAVLKRAFVLRFQPRCALSDGVVIAAEAFVTWPHRRHGLVPSGALLPLADLTGTATALGGWVLDEACQAAAAWPGGESGTVAVCVAVSARQIDEGCLPAQAARALRRAGLPPERLELALPEAAMLGRDAEGLLALSTLRDMGVGLTLTDFGAGVASLAMLRRLPLTAVTLDAAMVHAAPDEPEDAAMVRAVVQAAHALGLEVVADGVAREEQRAFLSGIGCDAAQGPLFGGPIGAPGPLFGGPTAAPGPLFGGLIAAEGPLSCGAGGLFAAGEAHTLPG